MSATVQWLLESNEPWTRYRTLVDLLDRPESDKEVQACRQEMLAHPHVGALLSVAASWPGYALQRHNDARHPLYHLSTLADFGLRQGDPGIDEILSSILDRASPEGVFQSLVNIARAFGGSGEDQWSWIACDAPTLLYALLAMGCGDDPRVQAAAHHLASLAQDDGWRCAAAPELGKFHGPGRRLDPCPIANVYALKALSLIPELTVSPPAHAGAEMLLGHWQQRNERKYYLFGVGTDFRKLKYPYVWYDILHVLDVLSRFTIVRTDPRFQEMLATVTTQADEAGRYTAGSMYQAWKGWSFADKKNPSPWLTFLVRRVQKRVETKEK